MYVNNHQHDLHVLPLMRAKDRVVATGGGGEDLWKYIWFFFFFFVGGTWGHQEFVWGAHPPTQILGAPPGAPSPPTHKFSVPPGAHPPPHTNSRCPPPPHKKSYIFLFANVARELILCAPTKIMLMYSLNMLSNMLIWLFYAFVSGCSSRAHPHPPTKVVTFFFLLVSFFCRKMGTFFFRRGVLSAQNVSAPLPNPRPPPPPPVPPHWNNPSYTTG